MTYPTSVGGASALGMVTGDYSGSRDAWEDIAIGDLIAQYKRGTLNLPDVSGGSIGRADETDFGNPSKPVSLQTASFFERYVRNYGSSDPTLASMYGQPPSRRATFVNDPNSPSSIQGTYKDRAADAAREGAANRASEERIAAGHDAASIQSAQIGANAHISGISMQVESNWKIAAMEDATRRYIAEGDWGVQKWVTEANNAGAMARLQLELGQRDEELAQRATEEKNRHHESMVGLALEVAKYDSELAASPRNWLKYAAWLKNRDIVVNGMTLAMASQEVPEQAIDPGVVANTTGSGVAGIQAQQELQSGTSGGGTSPQDAFGAQTQEIVSGQQGAQTQTPALTPQQPTPSATQLGAVTDYAALAKQLLGQNPAAASSAEASTENLQAIADSLKTTNKPASFSAWGGPTQNALGITIPEISGKDVDYRAFSKLLPTQQQMKVGGVESIRGAAGVTDWIAEMERSRPKGGNATAAAWG